MLLTKKLACPSCNIKLRVADSLPAGKMITCPKCNEEFPVPPANELDRPPAAKTRPRKPAQPPDEDEDQAEKPVKRAQPRKRARKLKQETNNAPLVLGLAIGGGVALAVGVLVLVILRPWEKKADRVAQSAPSRPAAMEPPAAPGPRTAEPVAENGRTNVGPARPERGEPPQEGPGQSAPRPVSMPAPSTKDTAGSDTDLIAAGQNVYQANRCGRCHSVGGGGRRARGPDLARVGASRSVEWLMEQIRDPQSHKPDSRMPPSPRIGEEDLRALATYLASLK